MRKIYTNGNIYTVTNGNAEAFVEEEGKFIYVGNNEDALSLKQEDSEIIDLQNKFVTAGFNDSHMHVVEFGDYLEIMHMGDFTGSLKELKDGIRKFISEKDFKENEWARGRGWNNDYFTDENRFPNRYDLDEVSTTCPICIIRACGHICVVNSKGLELLGITKDSPQVEGGVFDVDENGEPLGIFRENALELVYSKALTPDKESFKKMIHEACRALNSYGVTSAQTDDFVAFPQVDYEVLIAAYQELEKEGKLTVKINQQAQLVNIEDLKEFIGKGYKTGVGSDYFKIGPLKLIGDGSLGARTAYMTQPYNDDDSTCGIPIYTQEQLDEMVEYAHKNGMHVVIHCIGDKIMYMVVEAMEKALKKYPKEDHRHGIVHCQITTKELLDKFKELKLHAYIQSIFLDYDINIVEDRIGKERAKYTYNFKTLMDSGVITSNGSDCPVELPNVMNGMHCAVTRKTLDGKGPFLPEQALSVEEAIKSYTIMGAYGSFEEKTKGSIEVGKVCDFVVLGQNPFEVEKDKLKDIEILATYLDGKCVFDIFNIEIN